ncbi:MAG: hypothetical protein K6A66_02240 [Streptococcus sp.]|uniref:hypothetical protein n=1 Tax=Streptococcus sp. TaxID=1306 RepID=UPI00258F6401|nr:hypothetical protein [Streptococcus sp.]MCR5051501.1 hypothetical protein [Streptococcus sp.]
MNKIERLEFENKELRDECKFLRKMLTDERKFFLEALKYGSVEEYRKMVHINREHVKELHRATQDIN